MSDKELMNNYLLVLKSNIEVYVHGTIESTNQSVRNVLHKCLHNTLEYQSNTFDEIKEYGWYKINNVDTNDIKKAYDKLCNN